MRLRCVDRLLALAPRSSVTTAKCVSFEEAMLLRPGRGRGVPPTLMLEWLGQTTAILVAESTDYALLPLVGSFASCRFGARLLAGDVATLRIDVVSWHDEAALVDGEICRGADPVLRIERAVCAFVPLADLWDPMEFRAAVRAARGEFPRPASVTG